MKLFKSRTKLYLLLALLLAALLGAFLAFGPPRLLHKSETPEFCAGCHVMQAEYEAWFHSAHRRIKCIDCHLPNRNIVGHYVWKGIDGMKDVVFFYSGLVPEEIRASGHARKVIKANCVRCHREMISRINIEERDCWECHRRATHKASGILE
jgi:cytochrome c nitrite reductase small subunit